MTRDAPVLRPRPMTGTVKRLRTRQTVRVRRHSQVGRTQRDASASLPRITRLRFSSEFDLLDVHWTTQKTAIWAVLSCRPFLLASQEFECEPVGWSSAGPARPTSERVVDLLLRGRALHSASADRA